MEKASLFPTKVALERISKFMNKQLLKKDKQQKLLALRIKKNNKLVTKNYYE